jgi:hypothetical protein
MDPIADSLEAYNARDIDRFMACIHPEARIEDGEGNVMMDGHDSVKDHYTALFDSSPNLHARLLSRITVGNYVVDEEVISGRIAEGISEEIHAVAIYRIEGDKIVHARFLW